MGEPTPGQLRQLRDYALHDVALTRQLCLKLLPQVSRPQVELPIAMHTIKMFAHRRLRIDMPGLDDMIDKAQAECRGILTGVRLTREVLNGRKSFETLLTTTLATQERSCLIRSSSALRRWSCTNDGWVCESSTRDHGLPCAA